MAKRRSATHSDGRRAPSASASSRSARAPRPKPQGPQAKAKAPGPAGKTGGPAVSRVKAAARPAKAAQSARRGKRPDEVAGGGSRPSPAVPSSLDLNRRPSAARTGRAELEERYRNHHETDPGMTAGDIDADWEAAYSVGDEAPGGDNPTPGQTVVADVGHALGVDYEDQEELKGAEKIEDRDRHRWELDPASAEDYRERTKGGRTKKR
jgi:hypothetical protein